MKPRIVVVGNGPSVKGCGLGRYIDTADIVVRMNRLPFGEYVADAGARCDIWAVNVHRSTPKTIEAAREANFFPGQFLIGCSRGWGQEGAVRHVYENIRKIYDPSTFIEVLGMEHAREVIDSFKLRKTVSLGTVLLHYLLLKYGVPLELIGFDRALGTPGDKGSHFWGVGSALCRDHDMDHESAWVVSQVKAGKLLPLQGTPSEKSSTDR